MTTGKQLDMLAQQIMALFCDAGPRGALDHSIWDKAEKSAAEQYGFEKPTKDRFYAVVNHIYQKMGGRFASTKE